MKYTAIDIETYENIDLIPLLPAIEPDSRLKDEAKIQADIEKKRQEQISKMALNPLWGKIACIGYYNDEYAFCDIDDEKSMLETFLDYINKNSGSVLVTYNGLGFDLPFIAKRIVINKMGNIDCLKRYTEKNSCFHKDIMFEWCGWGKFEKLNNIATVFYGEQKEDFDVRQISELLKTEQGCKELEKYNLKDCELTYRLGKDILGY